MAARNLILCNILDRAEEKERNIKNEEIFFSLYIYGNSNSVCVCAFTIHMSKRIYLHLFSFLLFLSLVVLINASYSIHIVVIDYCGSVCVGFCVVSLYI